MSPVVRPAIALALALSLYSSALAQVAKGAPQREYPFSVLAVEESLRQMNAYTGARLPSLEGFITTERARLPHFERPYYEYKIEVSPASANHAVVRVKANVSAWYTDPNGHQSGYQALESSGRLENDLLDRLGDFLANHGSEILADTAEASRRIVETQRQQKDAESRISEFETKLQRLQQPAADDVSAPEFVTVVWPRVAVLSAPEDRASVLLRAQAEDEFQILEHRGSWDRLKLSDQQSGWVHHSQVRPASDASSSAATGRAPVAQFEVIRENVANFSGDWERLKEKDALYLWARPEGSTPQVSPASKLRFVESVFERRYREASHDSKSAFQGIVVIFLDQGGGVAAASLEDIGHWLDGDLAKPAFLKRCSFDPASEFTEGRSTVAHP
jgi:hypothetical protein